MRARRTVLSVGGCNALNAQVPIFSSFNTEVLCQSLLGHSDVDLVHFLRFGWPIGVSGQVGASAPCKNHSSAIEFPEAIDDWLQVGLKDHSILGPFVEDPFNGFSRFSPLSSVPKPDSHERRIIMDCSFPRGNSVNDVIPKQEFLGKPHILNYPKVDDLVNIIKAKGRGCALWKRDLRKAYRQLVWVDPGDVHFLGFTWRGKKYFDRTGCMGLRSSAGPCQRTAEGLAYIFSKRNPGSKVIPYLDDAGSAETWDKAQKAFLDYANILKECGIEESSSKASPPSTSMVFLGILLDTDRMVMEIPQHKIQEVMSLLDSWLNKNSVSLKETQSLAGKLAWMSCCVIPGRLFLTRIFESLSDIPNVGSGRVSEVMRKDILWWHTYLREFNGISLMSVEEWSAPDTVVSTDGCLTGIGGFNFLSGDYFHKQLQCTSSSFRFGVSY